MVSDMRQCAWLGYPSNVARSARSFDDGRDGRVGIVRIAVVAAALEFLPHHFAQIAARGEHEKRIDARSGVDDRPFAGQAALLGGRFRGRDERCRQSGEIRLALEDRPGVLVGQDLGSEVGESSREVLIDLGKPLFLTRVQPGAPPHEMLVHTRRKAHLVGFKRRCRQRLVDSLDLFEQSRIECDGIGMSSQLRLPLAFERLILGVGDVLARHGKHTLDTIQREPASLHCRNRIFERGRLAIGDEGIDFAQVFPKGGFKGGRKVNGLHLIPWRYTAIGPGPHNQRIHRHGCVEF